MNELLEKTIGSGAGFPVILEPTKDSNGNIIIKEGQPLQGWYISQGDMGLIEQNLKNIIFTLVGSRIRQESFGSRIHEILEEPNNRVTTFLGSKFVTEAIKLWEPRLTQIKVETTSSFDKLEIVVYYKLTNDPTNKLNSTVINYNL